MTTATLRTESGALERCPFCKGAGHVPTSSGMTDHDCLCVTLDYQTRLLADGRMEYAERCDRAASVMVARGDNSGAAVYRSLAYQSRSQARHLVYGCPAGPCTGNAGSSECLMVGVDVCDSCEFPITGASSSAYDVNGDLEATVCVTCSSVSS